MTDCAPASSLRTANSAYFGNLLHESIRQGLHKGVSPHGHQSHTSALCSKGNPGDDFDQRILLPRSLRVQVHQLAYTAAHLLIQRVLYGAAGDGNNLVAVSLQESQEDSSFSISAGEILRFVTICPRLLHPRRRRHLHLTDSPDAPQGFFYQQCLLSQLRRIVDVLKITAPTFTEMRAASLDSVR